MLSPDSHGRIVRSQFKPHPLLRGPHWQTIAPALLRPLPKLKTRLERISLPDGDFINLAWAGDAPPGSPIAILLHGLGGGLESSYLLGLGRRLVVSGWRVCLVEQRGAGVEANLKPRAYNHGLTDDLRHLWQVLHINEPQSFVATVGWSLGGNVLLKALAEEGFNAPVDQAVAVSVPFNLRECELHLRRGFARIYQHRLLSACKQMVVRKHQKMSLSDLVDVEATLRAPCFEAFDNAFTAPLNGYADAQDYYARAACGQYLSRIRIPTRILHALDDPFMVASIVPRENTLAPQVTIEISERGGHVGFVAMDKIGLPYCWSEEQICHQLNLAKSSEPVSSETESAAA